MVFMYFDRRYRMAGPATSSRRAVRRHHDLDLLVPRPVLGLQRHAPGGTLLNVPVVLFLAYFLFRLLTWEAKALPRRGRRPAARAAPVTPMIRLGVNIDHVATIRQARRAKEPDPVAAAVLAVLGGADGITSTSARTAATSRTATSACSARRCRSGSTWRLAAADEIVAIACEVKPDQATLVPERREELTTEGGLDVVTQRGGGRPGRGEVAQGRHRGGAVHRPRPATGRGVEAAGGRRGASCPGPPRRNSRRRCVPSMARVGDARGDELDRADRVVVAGDHEVDLVGIAVGVGDGDDRDVRACAPRSPRCARGAGSITKIAGGHAVHVLDAAEELLERSRSRSSMSGFLLGQLLEGAVFDHALERAQALDAALDGAEVGERAAEPAVGDEELPERDAPLPGRCPAPDAWCRRTARGRRGRRPRPRSRSARLKRRAVWSRSMMWMPLRAP